MLMIYMEKMCYRIFMNSIEDYWQQLDNQLHSIERYIHYLLVKRKYVQELIDSLTVTLENKYIDMIDNQNHISACEIKGSEIDVITNTLNLIESEYANIESYLSAQAQKKVNTQAQFDMIDCLRVAV
ncbi:hypothetical protein N9R04_05720 [Staphylococcus sp. SQ8-PEA]|uniref:Staphylococcal protein n=1 Tax=Staphylococcus marylandisciuri TaxID=2981529 RepID=A0ABT2QQG8_9STAP|nr:hypothetical protein [Staphylococcus marylandisciuri]MCU5746218.1 hypothetical protein [Staphylococcus marylandisciuri]